MSEWSRRRFLGTGMAVGAGVAIAPLLPGVASASETSAATAGAGTTVGAGNWVHLGTGFPKLLDDQTIEYLTTHYAGMSYNHYHRTNPPARYETASVISRIKEVSPDFPVLTYSWSTYYMSGTTSTAGKVLAGYEDLGDLLMPEIKQGPRVYRGDPRKEGFRSWLEDRVIQWTNDVGADGVFFDLTYVGPEWLGQRAGDEALAAYTQGMYDLFAELSEGLGSNRMTVFNGLFSDEDGLLQETYPEVQVSLLPYASGAFVEYFGWDPARRHRVDVVPYLDIPAQYPGKKMMFNGRGLYKAYEDYKVDYLRQRYDYVAYLIAASGQTYFKYGAKFIHPKYQGRTGPVDAFEDWTVGLGQASGAYTALPNGLYSREFEHGMVVLNPEPPPGEAGRSRTLTVDQPMFDPEGNVHVGTVTLDPSVGLILLDRRPLGGQRRLSLDLTGTEGPGQDWRWADRSNGYLHVDTTPTGEEYEHDLLLDAVRSLRAPTKIEVLARTSDPASRLVVAVEVDDSERDEYWAGVMVGTQPAPVGTPSQHIPAKWFRAPAGGLEVFPTQAALAPDGGWHAVTVDVSQVLAAASSRFTARRLAHIRLDGTMDLRRIELH